MIEREMEDLLAAFPNEFFPRHTFTLKGRQKSFVGVGRFDLLFEDQFNTNVLIELKARTLRYEDASQVAKYRDELKLRGEKNILMWLVAPRIPQSVADFMDDIGIQYSEIHFIAFRNVAHRHGLSIASEENTSPTTANAITLSLPANLKPRTTQGASARGRQGNTIEKGPVVLIPSSLRWKDRRRDLFLQNLDVLDKTRLSSLIDAFEKIVPSGKNARILSELRTWMADPKSGWRIESGQSLLRWATTDSWMEAVPKAESLWHYMFGRPVPTWQMWDQSQRKYLFDSEGWMIWYESLPH